MGQIYEILKSSGCRVQLLMALPAQWKSGWLVGFGYFDRAKDAIVQRKKLMEINNRTINQ